MNQLFLLSHIKFKLDPCGMICYNCTSCSKCTQCLSQFPFQSMDNSPFAMTWSCTVLQGDGSCPWPFNGSLPSVGDMTVNSYILSFPAYTFAPGNYQFGLQGVKNPYFRTASSLITIEMSSNEVPVVNIQLPPVAKVNPTEQYVLQGSASLPYVSSFTFLWNVTNAETGEILDLKDPSIANGPDKKNLIIKPDVLDEGADYEIKLIATGSSKETGFSIVRVYTNEPPTLGTCQVSPSTGIDVNTTFTISCSGWEDDDSPLLYSFAITSSTGAVIPLVRNPQSLSSTDCLLPSGIESQNYSYPIVATIYDSLGAITIFDLITVQVKSIASTLGSSAEVASAVADLVSTQLTSSALEGSQDEVLQLATVATQILNSLGNATDNGTAIDTSSIRETILTAIFDTNDLESATSGSIVQSMSVVAGVISQPDQITESSQSSAASFIEVMATATLSTGIDAEKGTVFVDTLDKLMNVAVVNSDTSSSSNSSEAAGNSSLAEATTSKILSSVGLISQASVQNQVVGSDAVNMNAGNIAITVQVRKCHLNEPFDCLSLYLIDDDSSFTGSQKVDDSSAGISNFSASNFVDPGSPFYAQVSTFGVNPFFWSPASEK